MLKLKIGSRIVNLDGNILHMDVEPFLKNDRTFVPVRFVAEAFGYNVEWNEALQEVTIYERRKYFDTIDDAAFDWAMHWNAMSIALFKEMSGIIYKDDNGYYWDRVKIGQDKEVIFNIAEVRKGVASIHSHSGGKVSMTDTMSKADRECAKSSKRPIYMVDSGGQLWVYECDPENPQKGQVLARRGAPCDARYMDIKENSRLTNEYFARGYHDLKEYEFGYKADYYNKLFMKGLNYHDERAV